MTVTKQIDARGGSGRTALIFAAGTGRADVVDLLLQSGADRDVKDVRARIALDYAIERSRLGVLRVLLIRRPAIEADHRPDPPKAPAPALPAG